MNRRYKSIKKKLIEQLSPDFLEIRDDSALHNSHRNIKEGQIETHFYIKIKSSIFENKSKLTMHKMVYEILNDEFTNGLHALELDLSHNK